MEVLKNYNRINLQTNKHLDAFSLLRQHFSFTMFHPVLHMLSCVIKALLSITFVLISRPHNLAFPVPESLGFERYLPSLRKWKYTESDSKLDTLKMVQHFSYFIRLVWNVWVCIWASWTYAWSWWFLDHVLSGSKVDSSHALRGFIWTQLYIPHFRWVNYFFNEL